MEDFPELEWKQSSSPGLRLAFLDGSEDGSAWVLIELAPGTAYPPHRHRGPEEVLVLRGSYRDAAGEAGALLYARAERGIERLEAPGAG